MRACRKFCPHPRPHGRGWRWLAAGFAGLMAMAGALGAAEVADAQRALQSGNYAEAVTLTGTGVTETPGNEDWLVLQLQALLAVGRYTDAETAADLAIARLPQSLKLRWVAREVALANGHPGPAAKLVTDIGRLYASRRWAYTDAPNLTIFGRAALLLGADPKEVLEKIYGPAQKMAPGLRDVYLARGELALEKHDFALAATAFSEGLKQLPDDPDLNCGLAQAHADGDRATMVAAVDAALKQNPRHVPSLLLLAEQRIDEENYPEADKLLDSVIAVNPHQPDAWALRSVLAHLRNNPTAEKMWRDSALQSWAENPRVDWLIGQKLSQKYRFAEGAAHQRQALQFDPDYLPAKAALATDLLRLGEEGEGWQLAEAVHTADAYDVEAFNLATLHDTMAKYATLTNDDFVVRMSAHEAAIYGPQALELLGRAKQQLTAKYGVELARPTYVEIFADTKDFAVRTFGMPDIPGFLGVCFGRVVTANSPAATAGHSTNWQSVLWHEFCHVVTLQLTQNKMPRWLSEGISVYEERQANPAWGQHMTPQYREMILGGELTPVEKMSAAFLTPPSPQHLQFAYYQASLVVEFLVSHYGQEKVRAVLRDLRDGDDINRALTQQVAPLPTIEKEFTAFARERAGKLGVGLDWETPPGQKPAASLGPWFDSSSPRAAPPPRVSAVDLADWASKHPDNYWVLLQQGRRLIDERKWAEAKVPLIKLLVSYPDQRGVDSALRLLAIAQRALSETEPERATWSRLAALDDEAPDAYVRLMEIGTEAKDWPLVALNARRFLEVNPLVAPPYRFLAQAEAELGDTSAAIAANRTLLLLEPPNPGEVHFQLAQLLQRSGDPEAKRQVLMALEDAPRHRAALNLLLSLEGGAAAAVDPAGASATKIRP